MDLYDELKDLVSALHAHEIPYALCGGLALAVHGIPRSTIDIDLMVENTNQVQIRVRPRLLTKQVVLFSSEV